MLITQIHKFYSLYQLLLFKCCLYGHTVLLHLNNAYTWCLIWEVTLLNDDNHNDRLFDRPFTGVYPSLSTLTFYIEVMSLHRCFFSKVTYIGSMDFFSLFNSPLPDSFLLLTVITQKVFTNTLTTHPFKENLNL